MMKSKIYAALIENGYSERSARYVLDDLLQLSYPLNEYLLEWLEEGSCRNYIYEEFSIQNFQEKRKMKYPAALLTMDWLIKDPQKAKESLKRGLR